MRVTSSDVARRAGLSVAVVSYVFNDGPRPVSPATRERVLTAARELGYRPNRLARGLRGGRSGFTGVLSPDSSVPYFAELNHAIVHELHAHDSMPLLAYGNATAGGDAAALESFASVQIDDLVVVWSGEEAMTQQAPVSTVFVHHRPVGAEGPFIEADNRHSVQLAYEHLEGHGHTRPMLWTTFSDVGPVGERVEAWQAVTGTGAGPVRSGPTSSEARDHALRLAAGGAVPAAIICTTDQLAFGVIAGLWAAGLRVPEDIAVISLDGSAPTEFTVPPLTVVRQPVRQMAAAAVAALRGSTLSTDTSQLGQLLIRRSCGC